jgi:hypothetical protein
MTGMEDSDRSPSGLFGYLGGGVGDFRQAVVGGFHRTVLHCDPRVRSRSRGTAVQDIAALQLSCQLACNSDQRAGPSLHATVAEGIHIIAW